MSRVVVLMGGDSSEREISLRSGKAVAAALRSRGHAVQESDVRGRDLAGSLNPSGADLVFIALHGRYGEDGQVQSQCERMGVAYCGSGPQASALAMDKALAKQRFRAAGLPTPDWVLILHGQPWKERLADLPQALVVKPSREGSSIGMVMVQGHGDVPEALRHAQAYDNEVLVEERVGGRELTVGILGQQALPVIEIVPKSGVYDYHSKYTVGSTDYVLRPRLQPGMEQRLQALGLEAFRTLGCRDFGRVDIMLTPEGQPRILEVNTIPGFTETSLLPKAAAQMGLSFEDLVERILGMGLERAQVNAA